ncbi:hypothetical protein ACOZ4L_15720 (plasmid) [Haloplanus ruber]|uniref:ArsR family transcriptional regulator n=1 Tax=Haloplanus ruber TaxID=869892 RepID=A0ABD6D1S1_9EURY|nr:hypothetical protein [Haloplanus ruber]
MSRFDLLPHDVRTKLKTDPRHVSGNELLPAEVALTMYENDRPIWTASQMQSELDTSHGKETVRKKLNTLDEVEVCESMPANNGRIYWWSDDRSDWPIPPDIIVDGQQELTVAELINPWYSKVGLIGLLVPALAGIPLLVGIFAIGGTISIPVSGTELLSMGMIAIVLSYILLAYAGLIGIVQWATGNTIGVGFLDS